MRGGRAVKPFKSPKGFYTLALAPDIGRVVEGILFVPELTDEGILYRPVDKPKPVPTWATKKGGK